MSIDSQTFREMMGCFATGVTVVTLRDSDGTRWGMTASSIASVSLDPPLLLVCVGHDTEFHAPMSEATSFVVNVLAQDQEDISRHFADRGRTDKFEGVDTSKDMLNAPTIAGAIATVGCNVHGSFAAGDHTVFVGRVETGEIHGGAPLLHCLGKYGRLDSRADRQSDGYTTR